MKIAIDQKRTFIPLAGFASASAFLIAKTALAAPSQEDVFRSIKDNVGQSTDPRKLLAFLIGAVAVVALLTVFSHWRNVGGLTPNSY